MTLQPVEEILNTLNKYTMSKAYINAVIELPLTIVHIHVCFYIDKTLLKKIFSASSLYFHTNPSQKLSDCDFAR